MIKAILFDVDNTLIDFAAMKFQASHAALRAMIGAGLDIKEQEAQDILYGLFDVHGIEDHTIFQKFLEQVAGEVDYRVLSKGIVAYRRMREGFLKPYPHVQETLLKLKLLGLRLGVVTDAAKLKCWMRLAHLHVTECFDVVVTFDDTQEHKPAPRPFEMALERLDVSPSEVLMVGDNGSRDVLGAQKMGIKAVHALYGKPEIVTEGYKQKGGDIVADYSIHSFKELLDVPEVQEIVKARGASEMVALQRKFL